MARKKKVEENPKPKLTIRINSSEGNIFYILAQSVKLLPKEEGDRLREDISESESYDDAIYMIKEYIDLKFI